MRSIRREPHGAMAETSLGKMVLETAIMGTLYQIPMQLLSWDGQNTHRLVDI